MVLSTNGGLYRYQLHDVVEVTGHLHQAPTLRFMGKAQGGVDLCGEKLNEIHVRQCIDETLKDRQLTAKYYLLAPTKDKNWSKGYTLFLESPNLSENVTDSLCQQLDRRFVR